MLVKNNHDNDFNGHFITKIISITLNNQAINDDQVITKAYVDQFHQENEQSRRSLGNFFGESSDLVKNNHDNNFNDEELTNLDSNIVNRNPSLDIEVRSRKYVDDFIGSIVLRLNESLDNYLKVSVGNHAFNLTNYKKRQIV